MSHDIFDTFRDLRTTRGHGGTGVKGVRKPDEFSVLLVSLESETLVWFTEQVLETCPTVNYSKESISVRYIFYLIFR